MFYRKFTLQSIFEYNNDRVIVTE